MSINVIIISERESKFSSTVSDLIVRSTYRHLFWCLTFSSSGSMFEAVDIHRYMLLKVNHLPSCKTTTVQVNDILNVLVTSYTLNT